MSASGSKEPALPRVSSGIDGLDTILRGGWLRGGLYLVLGPPGAGKTIFGNQSCFRHVAAGGRAVYVTLLAESHGRMLAHLRSMDFFQPESIGQELYYLNGYQTLRGEGSEGLARLLQKVVREREATMLVVDGMGAVEEVAGSNLTIREFLHGLAVHNAVAGCTTLLLANQRSRNASHPEYTMVDGLLSLDAQLVGMSSIRKLEVVKFRGSGQLTGLHTFEITNAGLRVHPRTEALYTARPEVVPDPAIQMEFGIPRLDEMLGGGVIAFSSTLVMGSPASGKTLLGLHFLAAGAQKGEPGLFLGFSEIPERLLQKAALIGLDLKPYVKARRLFLESRVPVERLPDDLAQDLLGLIERHRIRRLVVDGLEPFLGVAIDPDRSSQFITALTNAIRERRVTALFTQQTPSLFGPELQPSLPGAAAVIDNMLLLRYVELRGRLRRLFSILKARESANDPGFREFSISSRGIDVEGTFESAESLVTGLARPIEPARPPARKRPSPSRRRRR